MDTLLSFFTSSLIKFEYMLVEQDKFAGLSKYFLFVVSNKYTGKSSAKWRPHGNAINLFVHCLVETEFN